MSLKASLLSSVLCASACAGDPTRGSHHGFVVDEIGRTVEFAEPVPARLFVDYRAVSYPGRIVEYGVELDGLPVVVTYAIDPSSQRPLQTRIYDGVSLTPLLALLADDRTLDVTAGDGLAALTVHDYTDPTAAAAVGDAMAIAPSLRPLLDAVLPARSELAPVPAFWQNVDQPTGGDGEVGHTSSSGRPLLSGWAAPVSLLGSLFLQSPCVDAEAGYRCPCMHVATPAVGEVETCTGRPPRQPEPSDLRLHNAR